MRFGKITKNSYLIRLEKGELLNESIKIFCKKYGINNASVSALGSVENPTLAHYRVDTKKYTEQKLSGIFELTNLTGTVGLFEGELLAHTHVTLSDEKMRAFGGHVVKATVSATTEVVLTNFGTNFTKSYSEEIGLALFDLPEHL